ncbi:MAG: hypothetical protein HYY61_02700 [Deltaproteobacteria bacterium]|nr:hypothetical protein [Deltaproteobacteria bacterium]
MKLRWMFNPVLIRKIIIILLAILIASITTSFSFGVRKAHGGEAEELVARQKTEDLTLLKDIISDVSKILKGEAVVKTAVIAKLEAYKKRDVSLASALEKSMEALSGDSLTDVQKRALTENLEKLVEKRDELAKSVRASSSASVATCEKAEKLEEEVAELKEFITALEEKIEKREEKFEKERDSLEMLIIQLTARSEIASDLVNATPELLLQRYNVERVKMVALLQERASLKAAIEAFDDRIERLEAKEEKSDEDQEKLEKYQERREKLANQKSDLEKGALRSQILVQELEKKLKETIAASVVQTGRGVRVDPQTGLPLPGQETMQPQGAPLGNPRDEAIRTAILGLYGGQVPGANPSVPTIQQQASPAPVPTPAPIPGGVSTGRGSRGISAGRPEDNSLRALIDYANGR